MNTRYYSNIQEKRIAKLLSGRVTPNSGGTKFGGGDVIAEPFLIEAKTVTTPKNSISVKKEWIDKINKQAFEQGLREGIVAIQFEPDGMNYFLLDESQMVDYYNYIMADRYS